MPQGFRDLAHRIATLDDGLRLPSLDELLQQQQVVPVGSHDEHLELVRREQEPSRRLHRPRYLARLTIAGARKPVAFRIDDREDLLDPDRLREANDPCIGRQVVRIDRALRIDA